MTNSITVLKTSLTLLIVLKNDLSYRVNREGLTDENLLLGLVLNNYERQLRKPKDNRIKIEKVTYV